MTCAFLTLWASLASPCYAFELGTHRTILLDALYRGSVVVAGQDLSFDFDVVMKIDEENRALDRGSLISADPLWHVDDEKIAESNARIVNLRSEIIAKLTDSNPQIDSARALLGRACTFLRISTPTRIGSSLAIQRPATIWDCELYPTPWLKPMKQSAKQMLQR
jgi:hypothetical protein